MRKQWSGSVNFNSLMYLNTSSAKVYCVPTIFWARVKLREWDAQHREENKYIELEKFKCKVQ
jgi:hypothetical protein